MKLSCFVRALAVVVFSASSLIAQVPFANQALRPVSIAPGSGAFTLTVNGTGFAPMAVVNWMGRPRLTEVISSSQVKASISAADVVAANTASITVTNPGPGGGTSNVVFFPITNPSSSIGMAITQPFPGATAVVAGDFNNDGKLDIVWTTKSSGFNLSLGNGKGGFEPPISGPTVYPVRQMITGDFNGDGKLDIVGTDGGGGVYMFLGNGDGTFTASFIFSDRGPGTLIAAADFNQDGHLDLYVTGWDAGQQWFDIYAGNGDGTFSAVPTRYYISYFPGVPAIGDFNGDGYLDLAVPEILGGSGVDIFLGGAGGFQELGAAPLTVFEDIPISATDMNHDGKLDLVDVAGCIWLGVGNGTFTKAGCPAGYYLAGIGDFSGDGKLDIFADDQNYKGYVDLGAGNGAYQKTIAFPLSPRGSGNLPDAVGDFNNDGKLDVVTADGYLLVQTTVDLMPFSLSFGSQKVGTTSSAQKATLTNVGTSSLLINKISVTGTNSSDFAQTNGCGTSLAASASCKISVTFTPNRGGALVASLTVSYQGTASPQNVGLSGTGITPPTVGLLPTTLRFATQLVGTTSSAQTATLTNTGDQTVTIANVAASGAFSETNNCPSSLGLGGSCQIQVVFKPTTAGTAGGTLAVTDNATKSPQKVSLTGTGTVIKPSPLGVNFGNQKVGTKSAAAPVTLTNVGANAVSITQISFTGANAGDFSQTNNCGKSIAAHKSCTVDVTFKPTAKGSRSASLSVTDNGGASPQSVSLTGTGT